MYLFHFFMRCQVEGVKDKWLCGDFRKGKNVLNLRFTNHATFLRRIIKILTQRLRKENAVL